MAKYRVPDHGLEFSPVFSLREDTVAERPSVEATLRGLGYLEYDLQRRFHRLLQLGRGLALLKFTGHQIGDQLPQASACLGGRFLNS